VVTKATFELIIHKYYIGYKFHSFLFNSFISSSFKVIHSLLLLLFIISEPKGNPQDSTTKPKDSNSDIKYSFTSFTSSLHSFIHFQSLNLRTQFTHNFNQKTLTLTSSNSTLTLTLSHSHIFTHFHTLTHSHFHTLLHFHTLHTLPHTSHTSHNFIYFFHHFFAFHHYSFLLKYHRRLDSNPLELHLSVTQ
jgi:hypothetical protein